MNANFRDVMRWISVGLMYLVSTIGLSAGFGTALSLGVAATVDGFTLSKGAAWMIGILLGLIIQWLETDHVLHPNDSDDFENWFIPLLIFIDAMMLFIALGGHLNIIWMVKNFTDISGMIVHLVGLLAQIVGAVIGSYGAEKQLAKVMHIKPAAATHHPAHSEPAPAPAPAPAGPAPQQEVTGYTQDPSGQEIAGSLFFPGRGWSRIAAVPPNFKVKTVQGKPPSPTQPPPPPTTTTTH